MYKKVKTETFKSKIVSESYAAFYTAPAATLTTAVVPLVFYLTSQN